MFHLCYSLASKTFTETSPDFRLKKLHDRQFSDCLLPLPFIFDDRVTVVDILCAHFDIRFPSLIYSKKTKPVETSEQFIVLQNV